MTGFTHLHLHTEYSLLDGAIRLRDLPDRLLELGMSACAITDHGAMYGTIEFYNALRAKGIKPIIGCEVYVAPRGRTDKDFGQDKEPAHLILLAENEIGYRNLMKLVSIGFIEGFYYRPRIDRDILKTHHEGLIGLSACLGGEIPRTILQQGYEQATEVALQLDAIFGRGNFFLELQDHGIPDQNLVNSALIRISRDTGIPLVATNDCHYLRQEDAMAHEILLCMQTGKRMSDDDRMRMETDALYVKSPAEMAETFASVPEAIRNAQRIAERCNVTLDFDQVHLPVFQVPDGFTNTAYLQKLCYEGLDRRFEIDRPLPRLEYERRLDYELSVISSMGYVDYYLVVWDFIRFARSRGIMVGPGRGSGAGSLAAWCLGITNIDPLQYSLIFERFLNAERVSLPDFDIDFCYERRSEVIDYVTEKYGHDHVAQVITFGTLAARAVIRDVARALDVPYAETDRIAKMVPTTLGITIRKALESNPELRRDYQQNSVTREVLDNAMRFEGMPRHASTHAAGVIIASQPLTDLVPLAKNEDAIVVQFDKNNVELIGLLKFDFLGLRTLTVLRDTAEMVSDNHGVQIEYDRLPMDDQQVFAMISEGNTEGVFQLESPGMTSFMKELQPESLEDIIAGISLYRPGPMEQIPRYIAARHDPGKIRYDHPFLEPILNVTYGCIVYQEQVMQIVRDLAGFSMGQSDNVRRAMSKKKPDELAQYKSLFLHGGRDEKGNPVPGAVARGVGLDIAEKIFEDVMAFAGYAFNKSHAASYAVVSYFTAWLKNYYPVEFMAAILNSYLGSLSQAARYVRVCQKMGIRVLPPDINLSDARFTTESGQIRFALAAVKNVGAAAIGKLIRERQENGPFKSYGDFLRRLNETEINRKMIESLIRSSALDFFGIPRSQLIAVLDVFTAQLNHARRLNMEGQLSLFELAPVPDNIDAEPDYPAIPEFDRAELLAMEKEMLGLYVTGHPLNEYAEAISRLTTLDSSAFEDMGSEQLVENEAMVQSPIADGDRVIMAGMLADRKNKTTRSNELMSFLTIEDLFGQYEVLVFPKVLTASAEILATAKVLLISGRLSIREDDIPKLVADQIAELAVDAMCLPEGFFSRESPSNRRSRSPSVSETNRAPTAADVPSTKPSRAEPDPPGRHRLAIRYQGLPDDQGYQQLLAILAYFRGTTPVCVYLPSIDQTVQLPHNYWVELSDAVLSILVDRYGQDNLGIISP